MKVLKFPSVPNKRVHFKLSSGRFLPLVGMTPLHTNARLSEWSEAE